MREKRPTWIYVAAALCAVWTVLILSLAWKAVRNAPSFEQEAAVSCGQFYISIYGPAESALQNIKSSWYFPVIRWVDAQSGDVISTFRKGEQTQSCDIMERRANMFLWAANTGRITPKISIHPPRMAVLIALPGLFFFVVAYLLFGRRAGEKPPVHEPYAAAHVNFLYNLLFCDNVALFRNKDNMKGKGLWPTLLAMRPREAAMRAIAENPSNEGRVRALAYNRLRACGKKVPGGQLFGIVVEVPQELGLDVLAVFSEGGVRYLNQSGKVAIFEGTGNPLEGMAKELVAVSQRVIDMIGPSGKPRLPPPDAGKVRMTFLVSDGLYVCEGAFAALQQDPWSGPVLAKAGQLLQRTVELGTRQAA